MEVLKVVAAGYVAATVHQQYTLALEYAAAATVHQQYALALG